MAFGDAELKLGSDGAEVIELQVRLAGFLGTVWDGAFGPGTERQVKIFQQDYMEMQNPTGRVEIDTFNAIERFSLEFPIDFQLLKCRCGQCGGFGSGQFKGEYRAGAPQIECYHKYEYPGIHKAILHASRGARFYSRAAGYDLSQINSGYRCWVDNANHNRTSTNHMGKAIDWDVPNPGSKEDDDVVRCNAVRELLKEPCNFQIGWRAGCRKALEPSKYAPRWVHMDVRCYTPPYLEERYFVTSSEDLDSL